MDMTKIARLLPLAAALATAVGVVAAPASADTPGGVFVALGESGAAGPLIPNQIAPQGCYKSDHNYAHLAAARLGMALHDATCSGAKIQDMYAPQRLRRGGANAPQLGAVTPDARIVTLDLGTNDTIDTGGSTAWAPRFGALIDEIHRRAPQATVYVMGKPVRLPDAGCFPRVPVTAAEATRIEGRIDAVNATVAAQAPAHHAVFVDIHTASIGHDACRPEGVRWSEGIIPTQPAAPLHANELGHQNEAALLLNAIHATNS